MSARKSSRTLRGTGCLSREAGVVQFLVWGTLVLAALCSVSLEGHGRCCGRPQLILDASVASDLAVLAEDTWVQFMDVVEARSSCFGDVRLRASRTLEERAAYSPGTRTVTVRVPATKALLQSALVHEWAHHVEFQCRAHEELRDAFRRAQGLPLDVPWRWNGDTMEVAAGVWADMPSEQYAEAMVVLILGRRQITTAAPVKEEAVRVIAEWAADSSP